MSESFDTALRERLAAIPTEPPKGWSADLRARLAKAWEADDLEPGSRPATVLDLSTRRRRLPRRFWLVAAAATAAAAVAAAFFNVGGSEQVVETEVPPAGIDQPSDAISNDQSVTVAGELLPANGQLVLGDSSGTPRLVDPDGWASTPIPCTEPCPGRTESLWQITDNDVWSPDGSQVAYTWNYGLYVLDVESGATRQVVGPCAGTDPVELYDGTSSGPPSPGDISWSPDGTRIMYVCFGLHVVSLHDDHDVLVADVCELSELGCGAVAPPESYYLVTPDYYYIEGRWSPDGRSIAVTLTDPPRHESSLHVVDATTRSHREVASQGEIVTWAPDGRIVYWRGDRGVLGHVDGRMAYSKSDDELRSIDPSGHDALIARVPRGEVSPDLTHVAYLTDYHEGRAEGSDVRVRDIVSGDDVLIEPGEPYEHRYDGLAWSPDGSRLAVSSDEDIVIVDPDGAHRVTFPQTERGNLAWLPLPAQ